MGVSLLGLRLLLELCVLAGLGYWGAHAGSGAVGSVALGVGALAVAVVFWATFGAPRALWHATGVYRLLVEVAFFGSATLALGLADQGVLAATFAAVVAANSGLLQLLGEHR